MAAAKTTRKKRQRGEIISLPNGAQRVKVYAGYDPLTGRRQYLDKTVPPGPDAVTQAEALRTRFINEINERRNPRTKATVSQLMDRYLELLDVEVTTRIRYEIAIRKHIKPLLGKVSIADLTGETLESFYKTLRTCRDHCGGKKFIEHKASGDHSCTDAGCKAHKCRPLGAASIRKIHTCLGGALRAAVRWKWITVNPIDGAQPPKRPASNPRPPTLEEATAIVNEAFNDLAWGILVWLAMTTGARRGELCALRWDWLDLDDASVWIRTSIGQDGKQTWEKDTKSHQQRRITLDPETVGLLRAYRQHCETEAARFEKSILKSGRVFSPDVDHTTWFKPSTVTQRYRRMCAKLGWDMNLHQLRHYSATELITAGVDIRTVAGRLGHGDGGTTTLKVYSAWVAAADQKAAKRLTGRMPKAPINIDTEGYAQSILEPIAESPYQKIAADLRGAIVCGALKVGDRLPAVVELASRYGVVASTAHRAIKELQKEGLVTSSRGKRAVVADPASAPPVADIVSFDAMKA